MESSLDDSFDERLVQEISEASRRLAELRAESIEKLTSSVLIIDFELRVKVLREVWGWRSSAPCPVAELEPDTQWNREWWRAKRVRDAAVLEREKESKRQARRRPHV